MTKKEKNFILAVTLQVVIIAVIIFFRLVILSGGERVLLKIEPVDPRDILRGDYVTFRYTGISTLDPKIEGGKEVLYGEKVYLLLGQDGQYWKGVAVRKTRPAKGEIALRGSVTSRYGKGYGYNSDTDPIRITYGIEEYFIPEGKGRGFNFADKEVSAEVVVDKQGNALLERVYIDGTPWP